uniref:Uncharacterized protein n=1 Tax=Schistocephalus solidus TaxID=70667 RepID=A0A0X3Q3E0_SCHSO
MKSKQESNAMLFTVKLTMRVPLRDPADLEKTMEQIYKERQAKSKKEKRVSCKLGAGEEHLTLSNGSWWATGEFQSDLLYSQIIKHAQLERSPKVMMIVSSQDKVHWEFVLIKTKGESYARQLNAAIRMRVDRVRAKERATHPVSAQPVQYQATTGETYVEEEPLGRTRKKSRAPDVPSVSQASIEHIEKVIVGKQMTSALEDDVNSVDRLTSSPTDPDRTSVPRMPKIPTRPTNGYLKSDQESNSRESLGNDHYRYFPRRPQGEDSLEHDRYLNSGSLVYNEDEKPKAYQATISVSDNTTSNSNNEYPRIIKPRRLQSIEEDRPNGHTKVDRESRQKKTTEDKNFHERQNHQRNPVEPVPYSKIRSPDSEDYRSRTDALSSVTYYGSNERTKSAQPPVVQKPRKNKRRTNRELSSLTDAKNTTTELDDNNIPWEVNICYIKHDPMVGCVEDESGPIYMYTAHQLVPRNTDTYSACDSNSISGSSSSSESEDDSILESESADDDDDENELERFMMQGREENPRGQARILANSKEAHHGFSTINY